MTKTHLALYFTPPNESDTEGEYDLLCGREVVVSHTIYPAMVTCKHCLRRMDKLAAQREKSAELIAKELW